MLRLHLHAQFHHRRQIADHRQSIFNLVTHAPIISPTFTSSSLAPHHSPPYMAPTPSPPSSLLRRHPHPPPPPPRPRRRPCYHRITPPLPHHPHRHRRPRP